MNLEIEYHEQAPLPPEVCAVANTQRGNLKRYLSGPNEVTHVASSEHQIAALESIIELGRIDKVTLAIHQVAIVRQTDDSQTWNMYYCQVSDSTILVLDGLMIDEDFCAGSMPCSRLDLYSYRLLNGKYTILSIVGSGERLKPLFCWEAHKAKWPYMPKPCVFAGNLELMACDMNKLATPPARYSDLKHLECLVQLL
jgi:hypothetical protein